MLRNVGAARLDRRASVTLIENGATVLFTIRNRSADRAPWIVAVASALVLAGSMSARAQEVWSRNSRGAVLEHEAPTPTALLSATPSGAAGGQTLSVFHRISWGRAAHGVQVGIDALEVPRTVAMGQRVRFSVWVRSTRKRSIDIRVLAAANGSETRSPFYWSVLTANGRNVSVTASAAAGDLVTNGFRLKAADEQILPVRPVSLVFAAMGNSIVTEPTAFVTPGKATIQVRPFRCLAPDEAWLEQAASPRITIDVTGMPAGGAAGRPPLSADTGDYGTPAANGVPVRKSSKDPNALPNQNAKSTVNGSAQGKSANAATDGIAWGDVADGLRVGVRIAGAKRTFAAGERVQMEGFLRNVTDRDISLAYGYRLYSEEKPEVRAAGDPARVLPMHSVLLTGLDPAFVLTLQAGDTIVFHHTGFVIGSKALPLAEPNDVSKGLEGVPYLESPEQGAYTVKMPIIYRIETAEEVKRLHDRSRAKGAIVIEPTDVAVKHKDGTRGTDEGTVVPVGHNMKRLTSGAAVYEIQ